MTRSAAVAAGELKFRLHGERLRGRFTLVKTRGRTDDQGRTESGDPWLLIHKRDEHAEDGFDAETQTRSVKTGRTNDELAAGKEPRFEAPPPAPEPALDLSAARDAPLPEFIPPMLATAGERPYEDANWLHEVKWDGYRVQAVVRDGKVKLWTRNRADGKTYFPELTGPPSWIDADEAVVDGEVVAFNEEGRPSFSALQERTGLMGLESRTGRRRPRAERESRRAAGAKIARRRSSTRHSTCCTSTAVRSSTSRSSHASASSTASSVPTRWSSTPPTSSGRGRRSSTPPWPAGWRGWWPRNGRAATAPGSGHRTG